MRLSGAMDADEGVAVAAFVFEGEIDLQRRPAIALCDHCRPRCQHGRQGRRQVAPEGGASRYGGSRKTRSYGRPLRDAPPRNRRASARTTVPRRRRAPPGWPRSRGSRAPRCRRTWPPRRRARAPRSRAHRSPRTGRARERPRRARRGSRTAPRARGRPSGGCPAGRGLKSPPAVRPGDHAHAWQHVARWTCARSASASPGAEERPFSPETTSSRSAGRSSRSRALDARAAAISLKCEPELPRSCARTIPAITPGYHLNKRHWNTVTLDGSVPEQLVRDMVEDSYDLVVSRCRSGSATISGWP